MTQDQLKEREELDRLKELSNNEFVKAAEKYFGGGNKIFGIEVCEDCPYKMHPCPEGCSKKIKITRL